MVRCMNYYNLIFFTFHVKTFYIFSYHYIYLFTYFILYLSLSNAFILIVCNAPEIVLLYVCPFGLFIFLFLFMAYYFDNFYPESDDIVNLSDITTEESFELACGFPLSHILLENLTSPEESREVVIPVRVIEWMEEIMDRGTVTKKQFLRLQWIFDIIREGKIS